MDSVLLAIERGGAFAGRIFPIAQIWDKIEMNCTAY
jgi:hypothetical protein